MPHTNQKLVKMVELRSYLQALDCLQQWIGSRSANGPFEQKRENKSTLQKGEPSSSKPSPLRITPAVVGSRQEGEDHGSRQRRRSGPSGCEDDDDD
jgi:hypothetical protein